MPAADLVGLLLGDLLDVDAADVGEKMITGCLRIPSQTTPA